MKVILTANIKKLGKIGDLINVKGGFARNYLFPQKMALRNTETNKEYYSKIENEIKEKESKKKERAIELLNNLKKIKIEFIREADEKNQLYGSVSKKEILNFLEEKKVKLLSDDIKILLPIRSLGQHTVQVNPYEDLIEEVKIFVNKT